MNEISSRILIDGHNVDFQGADYKFTGGITAAQLTVTIPGEEVSFRKYWGKELVAYLNEEDTYPFFRGYIMDTTIANEYAVKVVALDCLGWLTGHQKAKVALNDTDNIDGLTIGGAFKKLIRLANLNDKVGTDYIGDTSPIVTGRNNLREEIVILDWLKKVLVNAIDTTNSNLPRENTLVVRDDGEKGQLSIEVVADVNSGEPCLTFNNNDLIGYTVKSRKIPTTIIVSGKNKVTGKYRNKSAADGLGENFFNANNDNLESPSDCVDFARKVFYANVDNQYEITINTFQGVYLMPNDIIKLNIENADVSGQYRVVGKTVQFSSRSFSVTLNINRTPPILSDFLIS